MLFVKAEKPGPVLVQVETLTLTFSISGLFPVSTLKGKDTMQRGLLSKRSLEIKEKVHGKKVNKRVIENVYSFNPLLILTSLEQFHHK